MKSSQFALQNSRPINVIRIALAFLGIYVLFSMPREQYPDVPLYYVHILVPYPGASAEEIEKEITQEVEKLTKELSYITSVSSLISDGLSFTRVSYDQGLSSREFKSNYLELQSVINNIELPPNALPPIVDNFTYLDFIPIIDVAVYSDNPDVNTHTLMEQSQRVQNNLEQINNINRIETMGLYEREILVELDRTKMNTKNLTVFEVSNAIASNNITIPAGILESNKMSINVKAGQSIKDIQVLGEILIRSIPEKIYLKDIASINYYYDTQKEQMRYNAYPATILKIYKAENTDSINLVDKVSEEILSLQEKLPNDIKIATFADTTLSIKNSIGVLTSNALLGFVFLCLSLLIFLGWKPALISAMEIPFTFAISFFILKLLGVTLNTSTLFALVLVLGMIVDHGIVILENIVRLRHFHHMDRLKSVIQGVSEVGFPVISSTLTTIGTFLPLAFMPGLIGKFLLPVPITITVTLVVSTISALIIIPIHYIEMPGNERTHELKIFDWGRIFLQFLLNRLLKYPIVVCLLALVVAGFSISSLFTFPVSLYDTEDQPFFFVDVELPLGSSIEESNIVMKRMEEHIIPLMDDGSISSVITAIGNTQIDPAEGIRFDRPHNAQLQIGIVDGKENELDAIIETVKSKLIIIDDLSISFSYKFRKQRTGPPTSSAIGYRILGDNTEVLQKVSNEIVGTLRSYNELSNITNNLALNKPEIIVNIDTAKAAQYGHTPASLSGLLRQSLAADSVSSLFIDNQNNNIIVKLDKLTEKEKETLSYITFPSRTSPEIITFDKVASFEKQYVLNKIYREDGKRVLTITADSSSRKRIREINDTVQKLYDTQLASKYPHTIFQQGGEFDEFSSLLNDILILLIIGIFIVYVILVSEFKSYTQPLLIMLTILFTTIGVSFYLKITNSALSITVLYSFVALVGVVVNGAIVLVSTANKLYRAGNLTHKDAIITATLQRFKPILLTSITTIIGVLPTALGLNGKSPIWQPMASTIAVGLAVSTITTLVIIPAFYAMLPNNNHKKLLRFELDSLE